MYWHVTHLLCSPNGIPQPEIPQVKRPTSFPQMNPQPINSIFKNEGKQLIFLLMVIDQELFIAINNGKICPYCLNNSEYVDSAEVYSKSHGMIYLCRPCEAWVGVHEGTNKALGRLADERLRYWKKQAHYFFDKIAKTSFINEIWSEEVDESDRNKAYLWLSQQMGLERQWCHIGMFDVDQCRKVIEICSPHVQAFEEKRVTYKKIEGQKASEVEWTKEYRNEVNAKMVDRREESFNLIKQFSISNDVYIKILQPGQIRLTKDDVRIDIYTTNTKWHDLANNTRGWYSDLRKFLEKSFHSK